MTGPAKIIQSVYFAEHVWKPAGQKQTNEFDIFIEEPFSIEKYSTALFNKVYVIGLSEIPKFLEYNLKLVKDPFSWLNALEKLIKVNSKFFNDEDLHHRRSKLISQFDLRRHKLEFDSLITHRTYHLRKTVNGFTEDREYCFSSVKEVRRQ